MVLSIVTGTPISRKESCITKDDKLWILASLRWVHKTNEQELANPTLPKNRRAIVENADAQVTRVISHVIDEWKLE